MKPWSIATTFAIATLLLGAPARADDPSMGSLPIDQPGASTVQPGVSTPGSPPVIPEVSDEARGAIGDPEASSIEGKVAAVEHESGRFVLDTDEGPIGFRTTPDELVGINVGDIVRVSLVTDESGD